MPASSQLLGARLEVVAAVLAAAHWPLFLTGRHLNLPETETPAAPYFQNKRQGRQSIYAGKRELTFAFTREQSVILDQLSIRDLRVSHRELSNSRLRRREKFIILDTENCNS